MPTDYPPPVEPPINEQERLARENAQKFIFSILHALRVITYSTRSHVPGGNDCTDFFNALEKVHKWCEERPDWTLDIVKHAFKTCEFPLLEWMAEDPVIAKKLAKP